ncbi:membrane progestin receptor epsilon [Callorhinchus milii]|uniref:membrane progestin receptor epsilon n=1 Tax=Callorhinchus milii TaxID=7868 RepID=UPI000457195E|nr:membrane progestin receptor epsilon [Callorhinchus milii]|eukprot:gi/632933866/ref/XP_007891064.1/ PREDICTED: progestin and adipoQ receptor family member 9 [Callorhinchus milii]
MTEGSNMSYLSYNEIPSKMRQNFILSGYRRLNCSAMECLISVFLPTSETFNFWTHYIPLLFFLYRFYHLFFLNAEFGYGHPFLLPMWSFAFGVSFSLTISCTTHVFNCVSLWLHETFYYMNMIALNVYGFGSVIACYYYILPTLNVMDVTRVSQLMQRHGRYTEYSVLLKTYNAICIPATFLLLIVSTIAACKTYLDSMQYHLAIRAAALAIPLSVTFPIFIETLFFELHLSNATLFFYFCRQRTWLGLSLFFTVSKVPEKIWPGHFDILGHSHQWVHVFTSFALYDQLCYLEHGLNTFAKTSPPYPRFAGTVGPMFLLLGSLLIAIQIFAKYSQISVQD